MNNILRRGRLESREDPNVLNYISSMDTDKKIFKADLNVDRAHVIMLAEAGIINKEEISQILIGLDEIEKRGFEKLNTSYEDIHIAIEAELIKIVGEDTGGRMHTARSRNDEVSTCIRLTLRDDLLTIIHLILKLRKTILDLAAEHSETIMPGFTHLQHAQPTTLAHHLLAHQDAFERDTQRLMGAYFRTNLSSLGAAAFASTGFEISRERTRELLGFDGLVENSMDAVSTRDFIVESLSVFSNLMTNLSRLAEELILWSSEEFGFVEMDDSYTSTSSIMPQKKNPDTAEIMRAKTGSMFGYLMSVLTITKALPMSYNRDLQEVTPHLWNACKDIKSSIRIASGMISSITFNKEKMLTSAGRGFSTATELADTIVRVTGLPFRTVHQIVGSLAKGGIYTPEQIDLIAQEITGKRLSELGLDKGLFEGAMDIKENIKRRNVVGGPAPVEVNRMIEERNFILMQDIDRFLERADAIQESLKRLNNIKTLFVS